MGDRTCSQRQNTASPRVYLPIKIRSSFYKSTIWKCLRNFSISKSHQRPFPRPPSAPPQAELCLRRDLAIPYPWLMLGTNVIIGSRSRNRSAKHNHIPITYRLPRPPDGTDDMRLSARWPSRGSFKEGLLSLCPFSNTWEHHVSTSAKPQMVYLVPMPVPLALQGSLAASGWDLRVKLNPKRGSYRRFTSTNLH